MSLLGNLPLFHSFGLMVGTFFPLLYGLRIVSAPSPLDYKSSLRAIREGGVEVLLGTPTFLRGYLRKAKSDDLTSVRYVVAGAEKSPTDLINIWEGKYGCEYLEGYGLTECSPGISFNLPGRGKKVGSVGRLMKNIEGRTVDPETGVVLDKNETGILSFRGPNIFACYLNDPEKTREVFSEDGWFITGDLGRMDEDGFLFIEGRLSRFSKIGGEMVSHESVEDVIAGLLSVDGHTNDDTVCAVTGIEDESKGECLVLLSTVEVNSKWLGENLRNKGVPNLWIPKHIKKTEKIPVLGTGKLDLRKLKELAEN
jgi:acyl-[acyl-carrier-protein]-phospholipid O-acyltransferase/long-chain-fatty-acid--[acyl-carrier-protein] ligase